MTANDPVKLHHSWRAHRTAIVELDAEIIAGILAICSLLPGGAYFGATSEDNERGRIHVFAIVVWRKAHFGVDRQYVFEGIRPLGRQPQPAVGHSKHHNNLTEKKFGGRHDDLLCESEVAQIAENENRLYLRSCRHLYAHLQVNRRMSTNDAQSTGYPVVEG
jgi:hypothetical protein